MDDNFIQLYTLAIHECILVLHSFGTRSTEAIWTEGYLQHVAALLITHWKAWYIKELHSNSVWLQYSEEGHAY